MINLPPPLLAPVLALLPGCTALSPQEGDALVEVFESVRTSVVTLRTVSRTGPVDPDGSQASEPGVGSGVLVDAEGRILTAAHVIQLAEKIIVEFSDGARRDARILGTDVQADVGLIQLTEPLPESAKFVELGDSDAVRVGQSVFVVGAPLGVAHTLTRGVISARRTSPLPMGALHEIEHFQTDAPINPGNSGGPMFDMRGRVIGIVSHIVSRSGGSQGLGFAVTSRVCRDAMLERSPMWSGVDGILLVGDPARLFQIPDGRAGYLVEHVTKGSPGERAGLRGGMVPARILNQEILLGGDIVLGIEGVPIDDPDRDTKMRVLAGRGGSLTIDVLRGGDRVELELSIQ